MEANTKPVERKFASMGFRVKVPPSWPVPVSKSGALTLPGAVLNRAGFRKGDKLKVCVRRFANRTLIVMQVLPQGKPTKRMKARSTGAAKHLAAGKALSPKPVPRKEWKGTF